MKNKIKIGLLIVVFPLAVFYGLSARAEVNYEKFTHKTHVGFVQVPGTNAKKELKCASCHKRPSNDEMKNGVVETTLRNLKFSLRFPNHSACIECHVNQFVSKPQKTCTICHDTKGGLVKRPPERDFPKRYDFNALFDLKQHQLHSGKYKLPGSSKNVDCNFCHKQNARPTILELPSHTECFTCHSPLSGDQKASKKSDCRFCHTERTEDASKLAPFAAKYLSRAYGAKFTHKSHVAYMGNRCDMCHSINNTNGNQTAPSTMRIKEHPITPAEKTAGGCFNCHDGGIHYGKKVFGGEPGAEGGGSCTKCHTNKDFKILPSL